MASYTQKVNLLELLQRLVVQAGEIFKAMVYSRIIWASLRSGVWNLRFSKRPVKSKNLIGLSVSQSVSQSVSRQ